MHRVIVCLLLISNAAGFSPGAPGLARSNRLAGTCDAARQRLCTGRLTLLQTLRSQLDKVEVSAVQRMTKGYDKLCKNCPTRLQPRVDTLTEMIVGLPADEREELFKMVTQRASAAGDAGEMHEGVSSPREVYDFQLTGKIGMEAAAGAGMTPSMTEKSATAMPAKGDKERMKLDQKDGMKDSTYEGSDKATMKLMEKMEKYRGKIAKNTMKLARAQRMLAVADILIAQGVDAQIPECATDTVVAEIAPDIAELRMMPRDKIELKRLKFLEKEAKYLRKVAEYQMDLAEKTKDLEKLQSVLVMA